MSDTLSHPGALPANSADIDDNDNYSELDHSPIAPGDIAVGVVIGRASEYFDFFVYGIASALVFPSIFFPFESRLDGTLYSFAIFSFAFIARPIGTVIFMAIQQRFGLEFKLTVALFLLGISTAGIAFLPDFAHLGYTSIILLSVLRIGQGLALGGSWDGLPSLLALHAPENRKGWYSMMGQLGAPVGFMVAGGVFAYMLGNISTEDFLEWGWRYPFYVAFAINVVALFSRLRLVSTKEYAYLLTERELQPTGVVEMSRSQWRTIGIGALAALGSYALFHVVTIFPLSWIKLYSLRSLSGFLVVQVCGAGLMALSVIASGLLADKIGRRTTLEILALFVALFSWFVPALISGGEVGEDVFILLGFVVLGLSYGQATGVVTANLPMKYRYTGAAVTADISWLVGAAFAPLVALGLSAHFGLAYVSFYLLSGAISSLAALNLNRVLDVRR